MKTTLILLLTALSTLGAEILTTKRDAGVVSYPATTIVNSAIFETDGSGNVVMTPKSVYATIASLSGYLTTATAAATYAPISTTVTLAGTQTITGAKTFTNLSAANPYFTGETAIESAQLDGEMVFGQWSSIAFNGTTYTYGMGSAAAHRTALGLGALATSTDAANLTGNIARARIDNALSANAAPIVATTVTASGAVTATINALGTTTSPGLQLTNTTAAAAGAQQYSPAILWTGQGWKTTATAESQSVDFRSYIVPVQGAANPSVLWTLDSRINGGAYAFPLTYSSAGVLSCTYVITNGYILSPNFIQNSNTGVFKTGVTSDTGLSRGGAAATWAMGNGTAGNTSGSLLLTNLTASGTVTGTEQGSAPAAPAANGYTLYAEDNGSGKTRLMIRFATGAAQQVAIEP